VDGAPRRHDRRARRSFITAARRWPGLSTVVYERLAEQLEAASVRAAIVGLPRVEERVLALLWHLADRWASFARMESWSGWRSRTR
jgi:hypothetical protein